MFWSIFRLKINHLKCGKYAFILEYSVVVDTYIT
jgi:hypothetical protein